MERFGAAAGGAEWLLSQSGFIHDGTDCRPRYAGALLLIAGLYQWSAVKTVCLSRCHAPMGFLRRRYRGGYAGAVKLGLEHCTACIGCCWALMLLAFVGGTMNLGWMVVLTLFVALEKLLGTRPCSCASRRLACFSLAPSKSRGNALGANAARRRR